MWLSTKKPLESFFGAHERFTESLPINIRSSGKPSTSNAGSFSSPRSISDSFASFPSSPRSDPSRSFGQIKPPVPATWKVSDAYVYNSNPPSWNCNHPKCTVFVHGARRYGVYTVPSQNNTAGIKKRAWEYAWKHTMEDATALSGQMGVGSINDAEARWGSGFSPNCGLDYDLFPQQYHEQPSSGASSGPSSDHGHSFHTDSGPDPTTEAHFMMEFDDQPSASSFPSYSPSLLHLSLMYPHGYGQSL